MSKWKNIQESLKESLKIGISASKKVLNQAGEKTKILKDISVLRLESRDLRKKKDTLLYDLGQKVYEKFTTSKQASIQRSTVDIKELLNNITDTNKQLALKAEAITKLQGEEGNDASRKKTDDKDST